MSLIYWVGTSSNDLSATANYFGAALPSAADDLYFDNPASTGAVTANLSALSAIALTNWVVTSRYTPNHGTATTYLAVNADFISYSSTGSIVRYDCGSNPTDFFVGSTGSPTTGYEALIIKGSALGAGSVMAGSVGLATGLTGDAATITTLNVGSANTAPTVRIGQGVTITTLNIVSGSVINDGADIVNVNIIGTTAKYTVNGTANHTNVVISGGKFIDKTNGTITDLVISNNGTYDASQNSLSKTVTDCELSTGAQILQVNENITFTNPIVVKGGITVS